MGDITSSSLERLKKLDDNPNLEAALKDAWELCTHSTRAEWLLRWLQGKIQSSHTVRDKSIQTWLNYEKALKHLSNSKIANILDPEGLRKIWRVPDIYELPAMGCYLQRASVLAILLKRAAEPNGAPIKALLRWDSSKASALVGSWLSALMYETSLVDFAKVEGSRLVQSCLKLWALRKPSVDEDEDFANRMLGPLCSALAGLIHAADVRKTDRKRKRDQDPESDEFQACIKGIEALIARHVFMPARAAFFASKIPPPTEGEGRQPPNTSLYSKLSHLREGYIRRGVVVFSWMEVLPILTNVALRCVSLPTPRQKLKEQPWVETLYTAFLNCLVHPDMIESNNIEVQTAILKEIRQHATLSTDFLREVVKSNVTFADEEWERHMELCAEVIELDPEVFALDETTNLSDKLFKALTKYGKQIIPLNETSAFVSEKQKLCKDGVAAPLLQAAAKTRKLPQFIARWHAELAAMDDIRVIDWCVWTDLHDALADVLEVSLTQTQITESIELCYEDIKPLSAAISRDLTSIPSGEYEEKLRRFNASVIVLKAVVAGIEKDKLEDAAFERIEEVYDELVRNADILTADPARAYWLLDFDRRFWPLASRLFEIWFPAWLSKQPSSSRAEKGAVALIKGGICPAAVINVSLNADQVTMQKRRHKMALSKFGRHETQKLAADFIACLCGRLVHYEGCQTQVRDFCSAVQQAKPELAERTLIAYPHLLQCFPGGIDAKEHGSLDALERMAIDAPPTPAELDAMFVEPAKARMAAFAGDESFQTIINFYSDSLREGSTEIKEHFALKALSSIPTSRFPRQQRESLLNTCATRLDHPSRGLQTADRLCLRFAFMVKLLQAPHGTAEITTNASVLWKLARFEVVISSWAEGFAGRAKTVWKLFNEVVNLVLQPLTANWKQERNEKVLESHLRKLQRMAEATCRPETSTITTGELICAAALLEECSSKGVKREGLQSALESRVLPVLRLRIAPVPDSLQAGQGHPPGYTVDLDFVLRTWMYIVRGSTNNTPGVQNKLHTELSGLIASMLSLWDSKYRHADETEFPNSCLPCLFEQATQYAGFSQSKLEETMTPALFHHALEARVSNSDRQRISHSIAKWMDNCIHITDDVLAGSVADLDQSTITTGGLRFLQCCIRRLTYGEDKKVAAVPSILPALLKFLKTCKDFGQYRAAFACVSEMLRKHNNRTNQFTIEQTITVLHSFVTTSPAAEADSLIYLDVCHLASTLLLQYRPRLKGRYHLLLAFFQALLTRLFNPNKPPQNRSHRPLGPKHAHAFTRLLTLFTNPPASRKTKSRDSSNNLIDESRLARARVGEFLPALLHHYCALVLQRTMSEGVREELMPGLWTVLECMELFDQEAVKVLSSAVNASERAVLRGVVEEWRVLGKWKGA
ncbi:hypothetical protein MBLNU230_g7283t1 [Neophaeotheca triangularis]